MALLLTVVFTATKLNDFNFLATTVGNNFSFDYAAINERNADFDFFTVCDHQNFSELDSFASCDVQLFQSERSDLRLLGVVYHHFGKPRT